MKNKYTHLTFSPYACAAMDLPPSVCGRFPYKSHMQPEPMLLSLLIPLGVRASATQLSDFPACGFRNDPGFPGQTHQWDECLWDCEWVPNPFHREIWTIDIVDEFLRNPANPEEKVVFNDVKYFMTTLKIPKDLSCLSGCRLQEIVSFRRKTNIYMSNLFRLFQLSNKFETDCRDESGGYFNCFLNHRKRNSRLAKPRRKESGKQTY